MEDQRILRSQTQAQAVQNGKLVETINSLPGPAFFTKYFDQVSRSDFIRVCQKHDLQYYLQAADDLPRGHADSCFRLIQETSQGHYDTSGMKWRPASKRREMSLPDMKYIILCENQSQSAPDAIPGIAGFASFMVTYEDGLEVVYVYEIHFDSKWQNIGLGRVVMKAIERIARQVKVAKTMLTVFKANEKALQWYCKQGYLTDPFSPSPKRLRDGTVKEPTYSILSKLTQQSSSEIIDSARSVA